MLRALAVGIPAGFLFDYLHTPIPWMIGPMIAVAAFNLIGVRMYSPPYARQMGQVILGSAVSLYFTPPVVAALAGNLPAILAATIAVFIVGILGALTLSRASGVAWQSTFFASIPGGAMAMAVLADRHGAKTMKERPQLAQRFVAAIAESIHFAEKNPDRAKASLSKILKIPDLDTLQSAYDT
ncbi:MAG TPA: AbrB family transcriptional regulator [Candidatus Saccharimonadales bacterium]|nr:AbrB family transcriptional regulator [Candidatus Saccharimonadales bacterium]